MKNVKRVSIRGLYLVVVIAMILSPIASFAIPNGMARAAVAGSQVSELAKPLIPPYLKGGGGILADPLLNENFEYGGTAGNLTAVSGGNWVAHSGAGTTPVQYITTSLLMPSYVSSGIGGSATLHLGGVVKMLTDFSQQNRLQVLYTLQPW